MKSIEKVLKDRRLKIESNNLKIIEYESHDKITCTCNKCEYIQ